ncbi:MULTISPECIES: hypothetical protein [Streptomyces]|uniref:hypothetical protein n=1 Tax=Streptomyces TaxID=1883 RepID=UPI00029AEF33|nr:MULTISPECIES: hypothetical protein [Streptomyces]MCP9959513.1 hypothetical protein [Streptomyces sudanensis]MCQ0000044.1 hypothetical protein [Streptomyces sudanensis]
MDATPPEEPPPPDTARTPPPPAGADGGAPDPPGAGRVATGHAPVDALLERLDDTGRLAADAHLEVYEDVHRGLRDVLAALDAPSPTGPPNDHRS